MCLTAATLVRSMIVLACGKEVLEEDVVVVHLWKGQIIVGGRAEIAIAAIWGTDGCDCCHVGFLQQHMIPFAALYNLALALPADTPADYDTAMDDNKNNRNFRGHLMGP
jgi:hypothetical protein